jgi:hypothetical protein
VIGQSRTDSDTCQDCGGGIADILLQLRLAVWASKPLSDNLAGLDLKTWDGVWGGMWCHWEACVKAKHSREGLVTIECTDLNLDQYAPGLSGSRKYLRAGLTCVIWLYKIRGEAAQASHLF